MVQWRRKVWCVWWVLQHDTVGEYCSVAWLVSIAMWHFGEYCSMTWLVSVAAWCSWWVLQCDVVGEYCVAWLVLSQRWAKLLWELRWKRTWWLKRKLGGEGRHYRGRRCLSSDSRMSDSPQLGRQGVSRKAEAPRVHLGVLRAQQHWCVWGSGVSGHSDTFLPLEAGSYKRSNTVSRWALNIPRDAISKHLWESISCSNRLFLYSSITPGYSPLFPKKNFRGRMAQNFPFGGLRRENREDGWKEGKIKEKETLKERTCFWCVNINKRPFLWELLSFLEILCWSELHRGPWRENFRMQGKSRWCSLLPPQPMFVKESGLHKRKAATKGPWAVLVSGRETEKGVLPDHPPGRAGGVSEHHSPSEHLWLLLPGQPPWSPLPEHQGKTRPPQE